MPFYLLFFDAGFGLTAIFASVNAATTGAGNVPCAATTLVAVLLVDFLVFDADAVDPGTGNTGKFAELTWNELATLFFFLETAAFFTFPTEATLEPSILSSNLNGKDVDDPRECLEAAETFFSFGAFISVFATFFTAFRRFTGEDITSICGILLFIGVFRLSDGDGDID